MQPRRSLALTVGALLLAVPGLVSCGFQSATNRPYTPAEGVNSIDRDVKVLNAVVVAAQPDSGTFVASISNGTEEPVTFEGIGGASGNTVEPGEFTPVEIAAGGMVNLATEGGPTLTGTFEAGDFLPLTLSFGTGDTVTMSVPVVPACEEFADADVSSPSAAASPSGAYACGADDEESAGHGEDEGGE